MKYLIAFEKNDRARWLGHLDILRTFERAIRRAELPIAFSTGFNPRERLAFASALSVGVTGAREPATIELTEPLPPEELVTRLNSKLPPGIQIHSAAEIPDAGSRDLLNSYTAARVEVTCDCPPKLTLAEANSAAGELLRREAIVVAREKDGKVRQVDIRPLILNLVAARAEEGRITFVMTLTLGAEGTAKPGEIVGALAENLPGLSLRRVHRSGLLTEEETPLRVALEDAAYA